MEKGIQLNFIIRPCFDVEYAIGLVGLVTLPATPSGHRPTSPMEKPNMIFWIRDG